MGLVSMYKDESFFPKFQSYLIKIFGKQAELLGWDAKEGEDAIIGSFRSAVIGVMGGAGDEATLDEAHRRFTAYCEGGPAVAADLRKVCYKLALKRGGLKVANQLFKLYSEATFPEEQTNLLSTIGGIDDFERVVEFVLFSGEVRLQDIIPPLASIGSADLCWSYFTREFSKLERTFSTGKMWGSLVFLFTRGGEGDDRIAEISDFFKTNSCGAAKRRVDQSLDSILVRTERLKRDRKVMEEWLK
jgi:aminopeptidase N